MNMDVALSLSLRSEWLWLPGPCVLFFQKDQDRMLTRQELDYLPDPYTWYLAGQFSS